VNKLQLSFHLFGSFFTLLRFKFLGGSLGTKLQMRREIEMTDLTFFARPFRVRIKLW
jgi:hypothetical protein